MPKEEPIRVEAIVKESLPNAMFRVALVKNQNHSVLTHVSGKMRMNFIKNRLVHRRPTRRRRAAPGGGRARPPASAAGRAAPRSARALLAHRLRPLPALGRAARSRYALSLDCGCRTLPPRQRPAAASFGRRSFGGGLLSGGSFRNRLLGGRLLGSSGLAGASSAAGASATASSAAGSLGSSGLLGRRLPRLQGPSAAATSAAGALGCGGLLGRRPPPQAPPRPRPRPRARARLAGRPAPPEQLGVSRLGHRGLRASASPAASAGAASVRLVAWPWSFSFSSAITWSPVRARARGARSGCARSRAWRAACPQASLERAGRRLEAQVEEFLPRLRQLLVEVLLVPGVYSSLSSQRDQPLASRTCSRPAACAPRGAAPPWPAAPPTPASSNMHAPVLDHRHPVLGRTLARAHARLGRLLRHRLVREDVDPDLAAATFAPLRRTIAIRAASICRFVSHAVLEAASMP